MPRGREGETMTARLAILLAAAFVLAHSPAAAQTTSYDERRCGPKRYYSPDSPYAKICALRIHLDDDPLSSSLPDTSWAPAAGAIGSLLGGLFGGGGSKPDYNAQAAAAERARHERELAARRERRRQVGDLLQRVNDLESRASYAESAVPDASSGDSYSRDAYIEDLKLQKLRLEEKIARQRLEALKNYTPPRCDLLLGGRCVELNFQGPESSEWSPATGAPESPGEAEQALDAAADTVTDYAPSSSILANTAHAARSANPRKMLTAGVDWFREKWSPESLEGRFSKNLLGTLPFTVKAGATRTFPARVAAGSAVTNALQENVEGGMAEIRSGIKAILPEGR